LASSLSILCVSRAGAHAASFLREMQKLSLMLRAQFALVADGDAAFEKLTEQVQPPIGCVSSKGYLESVLEDALTFCTGEYILRLDDDERCSAAMIEWMQNEVYRSADHWKFATANMWTADEFILNPPLWPDEHTRLSTREKSGGRHTPHAGSPYGGGELAPVILEHHKFVVKSHAERRRIANIYDAFSPGYGTGGMQAFSLPEESFDEVLLAKVGYGLLRPIDAFETRSVSIGAKYVS